MSSFKRSPALKRLSLLALLSPALLSLSCVTTDDKADPPPATTTAQNGPKETPPEGQLPAHTRPLAYALDLTIDPKQTHFTGEVRIDVELDEPRHQIWLHGNKLEDVVASYQPTGKGAPIQLVWEQVNDLGLARLKAPAPLPAGKGAIAFTYRAPFDAALQGLYKVVEEGESYAFSQFEATSARYCFPSFDEPRFKVPFDLTVRSNEVVVTTTPEVSADKEGELTVHRFAQTQPLPTYLIAFAVGPLDVVESEGLPPNEVRRQPLPFRGVAVKGRGKQLAYAMKETGKILSGLEAYFGQPYPFAKLDIIAVPDFAAGAMENVGAVTFREWLLLVDEGTAPTRQRRAFAVVMAHELAHMWFGNLVTMKWWDDIWLNEAFATWMAFKVIGRTHPDYQIDLSFLEGVAGAMSQDSLTSARQIRQPIKSDHDIANAFDSITYRKGGAVLGMFERYLTEPVFRDGIRRYMRKHASSNATYEDLLAALGEASGQDVATPFSTFLFQPGVPLIQANLVCEGSTSKVTLAQERYFPLGSKGDPDQTWQVPVCVRYGAGREAKEACTLLTEKTGSVDLEGTCPDWVMPNAAHAGYYRWTASADDVARLILTRDDKARKGKGRRTKAQVATPPKLSTAEWLSVADAVRIGFSTGRLDTKASLDALRQLAGHPHRAIATAPMSTFSFVAERLLDDERGRASASAFVREAYQPQVARLGFAAKPSDDDETRQLRAKVLSFLIQHTDDPTIEEKLAPAGRRALNMTEEGDLPDADLASVAVLAAVRSDPAAFDAALARLGEESDPVKRGQILSALPWTRDETRAAQVRDLVLDERIRTNEVRRLSFGLFSVPEHHAAAWTFLVAHFDAIAARISEHGRGSLPWLASFGCSQGERDEAAAFLTPKAEALMGGPRNLAGALEAVDLCVARRTAQQASARAFFAPAEGARRVPGRSGP